MGKGYWILHADVIDAERFERYRERMREALAAHEHNYLVRGGLQDPLEGVVRGRTVVIEFPTYDAALACWHDSAVASARACRQDRFDGEPAAHVDAIVCAGVD